VVFFGLLGYLAASRCQGKPIRWPALVVCGLLVLLVGPSRVYLAAHWPTDVLGGYLLGYSLWALAVLTEARFTPLHTVADTRPAVDGEVKK
jgi:membrane-associated phospholipid phosphatase